MTLVHAEAGRNIKNVMGHDIFYPERSRRVNIVAECDVFAQDLE